MDRTKGSPDVIAAWQHMVACARAFVRCADEFGDDIGATAEHYDALERAQERLARAWEGEPAAPRPPPADLADAYSYSPGPRGVVRHG